MGWRLLRGRATKIDSSVCIAIGYSLKVQARGRAWACSKAKRFQGRSEDRPCEGYPRSVSFDNPTSVNSKGYVPPPPPPPPPPHQVDMSSGVNVFDFSFVLPEDFVDYEWEVTAKGCFSEARIIVSGRRYRLNFYDPVRLSQEIESGLQRGGVFIERNLIVIRSVTRLEMERAAELVVQSGQLASMIPE